MTELSVRIEAVARALGVSGFDVHRLSVAVDETGVSVQPAGGACSAVDTLTAALLLLGHARGLRVDLGECPACRERGSGFEEIFVELDWYDEDTAELPDGWVFEGNGYCGDEMDGTYYTRPCPACTVDGKPTGRHTVPWAQALLDGMARDLGTDAHRYPTFESARDDADALARLKGISPERCLVEHDGGHWRIRQIALDLYTREALAVLADQMQASTEPGADGDRTRSLGLWLAAWLAGPCRACDGQHTICPCGPCDYIEGAGCGACYNLGQLTLDPCPRCHGHGTMLGEHAQAISDALAAVADAHRCHECDGSGVETISSIFGPAHAPTGWAWRSAMRRWERPCLACGATGWNPQADAAVIEGR